MDCACVMWFIKFCHILHFWIIVLFIVKHIYGVQLKPMKLCDREDLCNMVLLSWKHKAISALCVSSLDKQKGTVFSLQRSKTLFRFSPSLL